MVQNILGATLSILAQSRIFHWQTESYAQHKAWDEFYSEFSSLLDKLVEQFQGKYGRLKLEPTTISLENTFLEEALSPTSFLDTIYSFFTIDIKSMIPKEDSDMYNTIDEILGLVNKIRYLLTLS